MKIMKFGGSSVAEPDRIREVGAIILNAVKRERIVVVVSAFQGITNQLLECSRKAEIGDASYQDLFLSLSKRHLDALHSLHHGKPPVKVRCEVEQMLSELEEILHGISLLKHAAPRAADVVASFGERLSAFIITSYINRKREAVFVDAREIVKTDNQFTSAAILFDKTNPAIKAHFRELFSTSKQRCIPIVTGFIGSTESGLTTTIGRNGSDYSAAIFGAALGASTIEIWTDVDGILSADPRSVAGAFVVPQMSYEEAMELSYFGAKVLHSATIAPAVASRIPIVIKNTLNPSAPGTEISQRTRRWESVAKGITSIDDCTLLTVRGMQMVGVPGTAERLFRALASHHVNVVLISQASSEHTICFAIASCDVQAARNAVHNEFRLELQSKFTSLDVKPDQSIIAIVGDGMKGTPGVSGRVFQALGRNSINVSAIAQGASERNISFVIDAQQKNRALNVIHEAFFDQQKHLAIILVGVGNIGSALLQQLHQQQRYFRMQGYTVQVCGLANRKRFVVDPAGVNIARWKEVLEESSHEMTMDGLLKHVSALQATNLALVDCTASSEVVDRYEDFVRLNMHIVTPNKKANVLPWSQYRHLIDVLKKRQKYFLYEANVGAGLPVISTLNDLIASGDQIVRIDGIFSGTLSFLFNHYQGDRSFSAMVQEALELGFTEPDPREDLSGGDVARKLLILARQLGLKMELKDVRIKNLVPQELRSGSFQKSFFRKFTEYDSIIEHRFASAQKKNCVLRYVGVLQGQAAFAGIREIPEDHPFASTRGSDNIIAFTTHRYSRTPLVIQGPGAGADVTAMGVFSDILKLLHYLPQ